MNLHDRDIKVLAFNDGMKQGEKQGKLKAKIETAKNFLAKNIPVEVVAECTGVPLEEVKKLANEKKCVD